MIPNYEYRGKSIKSGKWVYGSCEFSVEWYKGFIHQNELIGAFYQLRAYEVDPDTIGQWTTLKDISETKIYQGDIATSNDIKPGKTIIGEIVWGEGGFRFRWRENGKNGAIELCSRPIVGLYRLKVIGNKIDNPELIPTEAI